MADFEHARALLRMAHKDFNALTGMMDNAVFADKIFGFHVQQATEKALKIWLCVRGIAYPPTHDFDFAGRYRHESGSILATGAIHYFRSSGAVRRGHY